MNHHRLRNSAPERHAQLNGAAGAGFGCAGWLGCAGGFGCVAPEGVLASRGAAPSEARQRLSSSCTPNPYTSFNASSTSAPRLNTPSNWTIFSLLYVSVRYFTRLYDSP